MPIEIVTAISGLPVDREALALDERPQLLGEDRALLDVGLGQDEHEFLAAVAADHVATPAGSRAMVWATPRSTTSPDAVAVRVVDGLEVVDVDEGDRQRAFVAVGALDLGEERAEQRWRLATPVRRSMVARSWVVGEGDGDVVDRVRETRLEAACPARRRCRVVARGDPLGGLRPDGRTGYAEVARDHDRGQGHADGRRHDGSEHGPGPSIDPGCDGLRDRDEEESERDRSRERQDPKQAHHARKATRRHSRRTRRWYRRQVRWYGTVLSAMHARWPGVAGRRRAGPLLYSARPRHSGLTPASPGGQRSRLRGRIGRPVRRPSDHPTAIRRSVGGATRESSTRVPDQSVWGFFVRPRGRAR